MTQSHARPRDIDSSLLRNWALPMPSHEGDKEARGHVLILGGSREMPGAVILAATAAMRAGAGKLTIATGRSVVVRVNDRGPHKRLGRLIDLSTGAARALRMGGLARVRIEIVSGPGASRRHVAALR